MTRLAACLIAVATAAACSNSSLGGTTGKGIRPVSMTLLPTSIGGLSVSQEKVTKSIAGVKHSYVDGLTFYTLRQHTNVEATLEVAHFAAVAPVHSAKFIDGVRRGVVGGISTPVLIDGVQVNQTAGLKSTISVWFHGTDFYILTVLQTYSQGRGLLEDVVGQVQHATA